MRAKLRVIMLLIAAVIVSAPAYAGALSGTDFQPGRIIDDTVFFQGEDMSVAEIQQFLDAKVPNCDTYGTQSSNRPNGSGGFYTRAQWSQQNGQTPPFTCLKDYHADIPAQLPETGLCNGISAASNRSAAEMLQQVAAACVVSPKVLLTMLQVQQGLVTDDWPWTTQYQNAMGYGCPDTAACDPAYSGLFNQLFNAARQFKRYVRDPMLYNYRAGYDAFVRYSPNSSCGGTSIFIQNNATAALYNYSPYQPNQAALNNLNGAGDSCSAYTIRNFWRYFNEWFGSTQAPRPLPSASISVNGVATTNVAYGSNVTLAWSSQNVSTCTVSPGNYQTTNGSVVLNEVTTKATYLLACQGQYGNASATASFTVSPPTFAYLRDYLTSAATKSGINTSQVRGLTQQVAEAEQYFVSGDKVNAQKMLDITVANATKMVDKKLQKQYADAYAQAIKALEDSWKTPPVVVAPNGGYPAKWADAPQDSLIDDWGMYNRECVSYTAFKVVQSGRYMPYWGGIGNANQWDDNARAWGIPVDTNPQAGDVAISNAGYYGFARYVDSVNADGTINTSQYNLTLNGTYSESKNLPTTGLVFIHFP